MFAGETLFEKRVSPAPLSEKLKNSFYNFSSGKCFCAGRLFEKRSLRALPPPSGKLKILFPTIKHVCQAKQTCFVFQAGRTALFSGQYGYALFLSSRAHGRCVSGRGGRALFFSARRGLWKSYPRTQRGKRSGNDASIAGIAPPPPTNFFPPSMTVLSSHISP